MHWTRFEKAILAKLKRPHSMTPHERTLLLLAIRLVLLGGPLPVLGVVVVSVGGHMGSYPLTVAGNVIYLAGFAVMALAIAVAVALTIIYGD